MTCKIPSASFGKFNFRDESGATMIEACIVVSTFFVLVFGLMELCLLGLTSFSMQYSLSKATRWGILGYTGAYATRYAAIEAEVKSNLQSLGLDGSDVTVRVCPQLNPTCPGNDPGGSGQYILITAAKPARTYLGIGTLTVRASILARNEDF